MGGGLRSLKSNNLAYIDTSYVVGQYDSIETGFYFVATKTEAAQYVFGAMDSGFGENGTLVSPSAAGGGIRAYFGGNRLGGGTYTYNIGDTNQHLFKCVLNASNIQLFKDGELVLNTNVSSPTFTSNPLTIFSHNRTGQATSAFTFYTGSIKYFSIKKNSLYTMYLIPRTVNGTSGFLNLVTNTMLYNNSSQGNSYLSVVTNS